LTEGAVLVGHSMGGAVALEAALRHDVVGGVVAVCTSLRPRPDARVVAALRDGDLERFLPYVRPGIVGIGRPPSAAAERSAARLERVVERRPVDVLLADYEAVAASDLTGRLGALRVPVAVLAGERDALVRPRRVAALAAEVGVEMTVVTGSSHQVPWEAPAAVAAAVERIRRATTSP
ncbi:MAG TPA: alpha/beta hydrolase, partial [Solirubrobacteraceae bacterium]|nr:alpha/beta hydrolase [Solirubrobacteraceae bacterium]